MQTKTTPEQI